MVRSACAAQSFAERDFYVLEQPRPAHRPDLRSGRRRQDRGEGELRPVLAQPGSGRQRRRQPEPEQQERDLHLDRSQRRSPLPGSARSRRIRPRRRWPERFNSIRTSRRRTRTTRRSISSARFRESIGARVGFVYKTEDDLIAQYNPGRPISAYTRAVQRLSIPAWTASANTADDRHAHRCWACRTRPT